MGITSPKSPVFRPQQSPNDMIPEFMLPENELSSEDNEGSERNSNEIQYYVKKQHFSCPNGPTLDIWVGKSYKNDFSFEMIEENDGEFSNETESQTKFNEQKKSKGDLMEVMPTLNLSKKTSNTTDFKRVRSQSENIT
eukprot:CAMPEP_0176425904 /NCGR_PEP_ID=MMETSP0127-20121128/11644_1 /TAXON_ID=938130 /ORGANISM="Platyophrya macrostoma, Strain WH" /LENGTH=137 /DNA_ID=CAMNT_0017807109 /DNA_START=169 /DNA_END=578 /DNA_ORIENTATION=-